MATQNHGLDNDYSTGDSWNLNDDMDTVEKRLVVRDVESNRGNYTPHDGAQFIATDTGAVYDGDGANWTRATRRHNIVAAGTVELISGSIVIATGVTSTPTHLSVHLDPSGDGANAENVKAAARAFWDNGAGEYKVELLEDGTGVGNPVIGYEIEAR